MNPLVFQQKEAQRFRLKAAVLLYLCKNNQILLLRRHQTGLDDGNYVLPMGSHDGKEPLTDALIREAKEECNITISPSDAQVCHVMHRKQTLANHTSFEQIDVIFRVNRYSGELCNNEPDKCDELAFYPLANLPANTVPFIRHAINQIEHSVFYSEYGFTHQ